MVTRAPTSRFLGPSAFGLGLTLGSTVFFSWLGIVTQLAYDAGASVGTVLSGRFLLATAVLWPLVILTRRRRPTREQVLAGLVLGVGYSVHALLFSESLARLDAGLVDLLLFTYPAFVTVGAVALRRDRWSTRRAAALGAATAGTSLVLVGGFSSIDALGAALALGSAVAYAAYILISAGQLKRTDPLALVALVSTGAAATLTTRGAVVGDVTLGGDPSAMLLVLAVGLVALAGMGTFIAGVDRLGPSRASIVSATQPALTPVLGFAVFADRLGLAQLAGGALVVVGILILEMRGPSPWLAWLPRSERTLVRATKRVEVPAGALVLNQGALADAFFVIERGNATVTRAGRDIGRLGPGDFFGELGLLQGGVRTASVVAESDMRIRVLQRPDFERGLRILPAFARAVRSVALDRRVTPSYQPAIS